MRYTWSKQIALFCVLCLLPRLTLAVEARSDAVPAAAPRRHLFLDPAFVEKGEGVTLHVNPAEQREVVIRADQPWEKRMISLFLTVLEDEGKLRMWYICRDAGNNPNLAYAESVDGITWTKPNLGIVDHDGSRQNNLVGVTALEGVVFRDPHARSDDERYVYVSNFAGKGIARFTSPDGLHWRMDEQALLPFRADTQNVTLWDARQGQYVLYLRGWDGGGKNWTSRLRKVVRVTADSLSAPLPVVPSGKERGPLPHLTTELPTVLAADDRDPPNCDVYNISAMLYPPDPAWYVGFPSFLQREASVTDGRVEVQFAGSTDGVHWHRYDRAPYAKPGLAESDNANVVFMGTGMVVRGDEIWQYGMGLKSRHGDMSARKRETDGAIYRYVQRIDGFVSLDFADAAGRCVTGRVVVEGSRLLVNVDTGALGNVRIGLLDESGGPIAGFGTEDCNAIRTNATGRVVTWAGGGGDLSALKGRTVRLAVEGSRAKLFSFRFAEAPAK